MDTFSNSNLYTLHHKVLVYNISRMEISVKRKLKVLPFDGKICKNCRRIFHNEHVFVDDKCEYCLGNVPNIEEVPEIIGKEKMKWGIIKAKGEIIKEGIKRKARFFLNRKKTIYSLPKDVIVKILETVKIQTVKEFIANYTTNPFPGRRCIRCKEIFSLIHFKENGDACHTCNYELFLARFSLSVGPFLGYGFYNC